MSVKRRCLTCLAALSLIAMSACGGTKQGGGGGSAAATPATPPVVKTATASVAGQMQTILVDAEKGMTLYYFTPDKGGKVTCTGNCLALWPPLLAPSTTTKLVGGSGVTGTLSTVDNPDGKGKQVMYNNWPLYFWTKDKAPGDTTGQGVGGKWFVVPPDLQPGS